MINANEHDKFVNASI